MKKFIYSIFLIIFIVSKVFSQDLDSLMKVIENPKIDRSKAYNDIYKVMKKDDIEKAKLYLDKAYKEALKHKNKTELGATLNYLGYYYIKKTELDTASVLLNQALKVRTEIDDSSGISKVYNSLGTLYSEKSDYVKAAFYTQKALEYKLMLKDFKGAGIAYNSLGSIYNKLEKNELAIEHFQKALKMFEEISDDGGVASCYNNIGLIYQNLAKLTDTVLLNKATEYFNQGLEIDLRIDNPWLIADAQSNIANIYASKAQVYSDLSETDSINSSSHKKVSYKYFDKAIELVKQSSIYREKVGDIKGVAASYIGMGAIQMNKKDYAKALPNFEKALEIAQQTEDQYQIAVVITYLGMTYLHLHKYSKSIEYLKEAEKITKENGIKRELRIIYQNYSEVYDSLKNYKKALEYQRLFQKAVDDEYSAKNLEIITEMQTKYETEKKEVALELANKENEKQQLKSERQMLIIYGFLGVFIIIIIFSFIVYKQFKQIRKSNKTLSEQKIAIEEANEELNQQNEEIMAQRDEIQSQKDHIEEIHKEVSDSIHYAERIQKAILPKVNDIENKIGGRFILFKPKDIVSGDFYWMKHIEKSKLLIATAADCTGHGVPGAFMSMLGIAFLNEIVNKPIVKSSGQVLDHLRQSVIQSLHQTGKEGEAQDGMDISLVAFNYETKLVQFSGANNPLYIIRKRELPAIESDKTEESETHILYEVKGDKMPIGIYKKELVDFTTIELQMFEGDILYMFSDGYADQFGGPDGKKLKYKPFKRMLLENCEKPMEEQAKILDNAFIEWRGAIEQIDDVIIMGIKV
ncbi:MAG: tetratricopeptide repeat protein [Bacteroidales bacterium]|nr:tetratricopeptide repeat protein [Bacteroidales bacterium]